MFSRVGRKARIPLSHEQISWTPRAGPRKHGQDVHISTGREVGQKNPDERKGSGTSHGALEAGASEVTIGNRLGEEGSKLATRSERSSDVSVRWHLHLHLI